MWSKVGMVLGEEGIVQESLVLFASFLRDLRGILKNAVSGVLATWPCSRTPPYVPPVQVAAALPDEPF